MEGTYGHFEKTLNALERRGLAYAEPDLMAEYRLERLLLCKYGNYVQVNELKVLVPGRGDGSRLMAELIRIADFKRWTLTLTPDLGLEATSLSRLKRFYKRFGFVDNNGENTDFTTLDSMLRKPRTTTTV